MPHHKTKHAILITGLPESGKTTFADLLYQRLRNEGCGRLNGEELRRELFPDLGFHLAHYDALSRSVAHIAQLYLKYGLDQYCIVDLTCPDLRAIASFKTPIRKTSLALTHIWMDTVSPADCKYNVGRVFVPPTDMQFQVIGHHFPEEMREAVTIVQQHVHRPSRGPFPALL